MPAAAEGGALPTTRPQFLASRAASSLLPEPREAATPWESASPLTFGTTWASLLRFLNPHFHLAALEHGALRALRGGQLVRRGDRVVARCGHIDVPAHLAKAVRELLNGDVVALARLQHDRLRRPKVGGG